MNRTPDEAGASDPTPVGPDVGTRCSRCGNHFSSEGRFCPFDGEPLVRATDWDPGADPLLSTVIDQRYAVEALIGEGGMGSVYRVRHVLLGKIFALKLLRRDVASDEEISDRFIHEARTAASVSHPGLVRISDFGRLPSGEPFFVMEHLEGMSLSSLLRRYGALPVARARAIAHQVAQALAVVHAAGIVHRDLKPDNIQVKSSARGDEVKIVDFGLAKVMNSQRMTRQGVVFGTPYYMSPEQAMGEPFDHRADIYALGIVLYEMLTGRVPFEAETYTGVLTKHITADPAPPSELLGASASLGPIEAVVLRCLAKKPDLRFASASELAAALAALSEVDASAPRSRRPRSSSSPPERSAARAPAACCVRAFGGGCRHRVCCPGCGRGGQLALSPACRSSTGHR